MVSYCSSYFDFAHTQQMDYQLDDNNMINYQITSSSSSSSPENFDVNGKLHNRTKPNEVFEDIINQDKNSIVPFKRQQSENTIEECLVKAGGINHWPLMEIDPTALVSQQEDWCNLQMMVHDDVVDSGFRVCEMGLEENNDDMAMMPSIMVPVVNSSLNNGVERKAICSSFKEEMMEKTVERRRKRMIKNRESAARSRARKQAHINQLELEVLELKKTNSWLKKQKEASKHLSKHLTAESRYQLRRTTSTSF